MRRLFAFFLLLGYFFQMLMTQSCLLDEIKCKEENNIIDCSSIGQELVQFPCANEAINKNLSKVIVI